MDPETLGILLLTGTHERAHTAFSIAAAAAALGRPVVLFATNLGCLALMVDWQSLTDAGRDTILEARGVAGLDILRAACVELGVRLLACDAGLKAEALDRGGLMPEVEVSGLATFLHATERGQIVSL